MNEGKKFESDFINSIDQSHVLVKRLNDNASAWSGGDNTRFASNNECDFILYEDKSKMLYGLELKSTEHSSLTFWREDFEEKDENGKNKHKTFMIRKCQIQGLKKWSSHFGCFGFVINFRALEKTYFVDIKDFLQYSSTLSKKSINIQDILNMNPIEIKSEKKRTRFHYDTESFFVATTAPLENKK